MGLIVYQFSKYDNTAEREQYRIVCKLLKEKYFQKKDELCVFLSRFYINDKELDGLLIKQDAIIVIEFKNYGGKVIVRENGDSEMMNGTIIKGGGSGKTLYQQVWTNNNAVYFGFKDKCILPKVETKALVVFNQSVEIDNQLSSKTQYWLHVTDNNRFLEKVEDITSKNIELTKEEIFCMLRKLNLDNSKIDTDYSTPGIPPITEQERIQSIVKQITKLW